MLKQKITMSAQLTAVSILLITTKWLFKQLCSSNNAHILKYIFRILRLHISDYELSNNHFPNHFVSNVVFNYTLQWNWSRLISVDPRIFLELLLDIVKYHLKYNYKASFFCLKIVQELSSNNCFNENEIFF